MEIQKAKSAFDKKRFFYYHVLIMDIKSLNLKKFEEYGSKISRRISLNKSYSFGLPPAFYQEQGIDNYTHAYLFFDDTQKVVGIQFVKIGDGEKGVKLVTYGGGKDKGATFIARAFFNKHNIDPKKYYGKYDFTKENVEGVGEVYLFQLKENKSGGKSDE